MTRICWPGTNRRSGPLSRRPDHEDSPGRRPALPAGHPDSQSRPARRLPAIHPAHGVHPHQPAGEGTARTRPGAALGDKAYSPAANCAYLRRRGIQAVIPVKEDQKAHRRNRGSAGGRPPAFDRARYKERNTVERCFSKLEQFRAVATRYDKSEQIYQAPLTLPRSSGSGRNLST